MVTFLRTLNFAFPSKPQDTLTGVSSDTRLEQQRLKEKKLVWGHL
jgi:hypothetical protein